ncbi:hypothetical protein [Pedobacter glucosidilyticus]|uniref:hypothetical protein n=1 Tax=Pedobacter glucosidilyticus TaxID=1122941 RepID=UPI00040A89F2|nr:hypothetical protein [Pedobacter glucosidilyticus]
MKKLWLIVLICTPFLVKAQNLVQNGDFEISGTSPQNFANWTHAATYSNIAKDISPVKINGQISLRLTANTSPAYITSDAITVEPNKNYRLKFTGRIHKTAGASGTLETSEGASLKLNILIWDGNKTTPTKFQALSITSGSNETVTGTFKVPATGVTSIKLLISKNKDIAYVDDIVFEEIK